MGASAARPRERLLVGALAVVVTALVVAEATLKLHSCQDDAFIFFRYAENLVRGAGLVYNAGERVEGFTSPLWVALIAACMRAGVTPLLASTVLGTACTVGTVLVSVRDARRCGPGGAFVALAPLAVATSVNLVVWAVSGMETSLFVFLLWAAISSYRIAVREGRAPSVGTGALFAAAALARPEAALALVVFGADAALRARGESAPTKRVARFVGPPLAVGALLIAARWGYYHELLPNTFFAKSGGTTRHFAIGLGYVGRFVAASPLVWAIPGLAWRRGWRDVPAFEATAVFAVLYCARVVEVGGDYFEYFRFLVPLLPVLYTLGASGIHGVATAVGDRAKVVAGPIGAAVAVAAVVAAQHVPIQMRAQHGFAFTIGSAKLGRALRGALPPDATVAAPHIGAVGYYSHLYIVDLLGLVDRDLAHRPTTIRPDELQSSTDIGHDHFDIEWSLARRPHAIVFSRAYGSQPFTDASEVPTELPVERRLLARLRGNAEYKLLNVPVDAHAYWAIFVRADLAETLRARQ